MKSARKLNRFLALSRRDRFLICEAAVMLAAARLCALTVPLRVLAKWLSRMPDAAVSDPELVARVGKAIGMAARHVPWNAVCLPQAMAAKAMLVRRGQGSAFHLGATIGKDGRPDAHAWLECDGRIVTGGAGMRGISHLARFG
jgi:hypothetical protein